MPRKAAGAKKPRKPSDPANKGRKKKWDELNMPSKLEIVEGWARNGATDLDMIEALGIGKDTFYLWKKEHPEFAEAVSRGKEVADIQVENALFKRALGYTYDETTKEMGVVVEGGRIQFDDEGNPRKELQVTKVVTKQVNPDVTAQIFWLKNRKPAEWRDKQEIKHTGGPVSFTNDLPPDEDDNASASD
jgi:hypothetical protein